MKGSDEQFKNDIDSILDERIQLYSKLFTSEEWDKNSGDELLSYIENRSVQNCETFHLQPKAKHFLISFPTELIDITNISIATTIGQWDQTDFKNINSFRSKGVR
jgi:hypothetical protein